jgi:hypothetical protein
MEDNFALRYVLKHPGVNSRAELVPSHGASRRRLGNNPGYASTKEEFRSRPINVFVHIFALSQSECVIVTTSGKKHSFE